MAVSDVQSAISAAATAQEAGDYATALTQLRSARMHMHALPDIEKDGESLTWDRKIDSLIADIQSAQSSASGIRTTKLRYKRAGA